MITYRRTLALAAALLAAACSPAQQSECFTAADCPDPGTSCQAAICGGGRCYYENATERTPCTDAGGTLCNASGLCVECIAPTDCGADLACSTRTCSAAGQCGLAAVKANDPATAGFQTAGDCQSLVCDAGGNTSSVAANTDVPVQTCYDGSCSAGVPVLVAQLDGHRCAGPGGAPWVCFNHDCVECNDFPDCPQNGKCDAHACQAPTCSDFIQNGAETDTDCGGGTCPRCAVGLHCKATSDCQVLHTCDLSLGSPGTCI